MALFKNKFFNWLLVILWAGLIFYLSSRPGLKSGFPWPWDFILRKGAHITEFGVLFLLLYRALSKPKSPPAPPLQGGEQNKKAILVAFLLSALYALSDEYHQSFVSQRAASLYDVAIDSLGILVATFLQARRSR